MRPSDPALNFRREPTHPRHLGFELLVSRPSDSTLLWLEALSRGTLLSPPQASNTQLQSELAVRTSTLTLSSWCGRSGCSCRTESQQSTVQGS